MATPRHLLMLHGNGGGEARFRLFREQYAAKEPAWTAHFPALPGFDGRPLPTGRKPDWDLFLDPLRRMVSASRQEPWALYGHGIGGSVLLEWARRGFDLPDGHRLRPGRVILHGCIGASLEHRLFPRLMRPWPVRRVLQGAIAWPPLRPFFERKLFRRPEAIPADLRRRFFTDYRHCAAFPHFFDLITPDWYRGVREALSGAGFLFLWGERERVVRSRYLQLWKDDFPEARFELIPEWDHFPMLDEPEAFFRVLQGLLVDPHA